MSTITLENVTGKDVVGTVREQNLSPNSRYTIILKEEVDAPGIEERATPDFYDDEADSESEIEAILSARTSSSSDSF